MEEKHLFTGEQLKHLIFPLIVEQILAVTVGMSDTMMISSAGEAATSGVSLVDMINGLMINVFAAISTGGAVVAAQYLGQKNRKRACEAAEQLLFITSLISFFIMIAALVFKQFILRLLFGSIDDDVMGSAMTYLMITAFSYPFLAVYNSCAALFRTMGNSKISMNASIIMNIINIAGAGLFIFVFHWGVAGAALAALIARMTSCLILFHRLKNRNLDIYIGAEKFRLNKDLIQRILHIGIPNGIENSIFQIGRILVVGIIALFGTSQIAANAVANNLDGMGVLPGQAMNLAVITVIGQCVGAGDYAQADYYAKKLLKITYIINGLCCMVVLITMPLTMNLYDLSSETLKLAAILVLIHDGFAILLWPSSFTLTNVLRAANDVRYPMCVSILSMLLVRLVCGYALAVVFHWGAIGIWLAMVLDWIVRSSFFYGRFRSGKWKTFYNPN